jgi:2-oxoisovalerate dehydrogenase E1 component
VIYVCENNMYATEVAFDYATRNTDVAERARAYGIPGVAVDGNDVIAVHEAAAAAIERARAGSGPTLLECQTYRTRPHAEGMRDAGYRTQEEIDDWKTRDPITRFRQRVGEAGLVSEEQLNGIDAEIEAVVADALEFARNSPFPEAETANKFIYGEG